MTAIKPIWNRSTKTYDIDVIQDASPLAAHEGYMVYDDTFRAIGLIVAGVLIQS